MVSHSNTRIKHGQARAIQVRGLVTMGNKATLSKKQRARLIAARDEKDEFRNAIESPEEWERLSVKPKEGVFARVQVKSMLWSE